MANPKGTARNLEPFKPGASPNPGGKPVGARNRLQAKFISALADDFEQHGTRSHRGTGANEIRPSNCTIR